MGERVGDYEWHGEGDGAEIFLYATDDSALERARPATLLPDVEGPVYAASSRQGFGLVAASSTHVAPDLVSSPVRGLLLVAGISVEGLGLPLEEISRLVFRNLSEVSLPGPGGVSSIGKFCESGANRAAEQGVIEEGDLAFLESRNGDPDVLGRRALEVGGRSLEKLGDVGVYAAGEVFDADGAEMLGIGPGTLILTVSAGAEDLGRLTLAGHRTRILTRVRGGEFGAELDLPAAPIESEEAQDLLAAVNGASNFADSRVALTLYALRQGLSDSFGDLDIRASWTVGGFEESNGSMVQRQNLAGCDAGEVSVCGGDVVVGTGALLGSIPPFKATTEETWSWEEAEILELRVNLESPSGYR